ncbi:unnamed protein product, partial [marine sediment metagenome]
QHPQIRYLSGYYLFAYHGNFLIHCDALYVYNSEYYNNGVYVTGSFNRIEMSSTYNDYYNNIISRNYTEYIEFYDNDYLTESNSYSYKSIIAELKSNKFNYKNITFSFIESSQSFGYQGLELFTEKYKKDVHSGDIEKR